jgi:hypothetical protein
MASAELQRLFPNGVPGIASVQSVVEGFNQEELARRFANSLAALDRERVASYGQRIAEYGEQHGVAVPAEVRSGDPRAIAQLLAQTAKSEKGIEGTLKFLQLASTGGGMTGAAMAMTPFGRFRGLGLLGLLADRNTRSIVAPVISSLFKK